MKRVILAVAVLLGTVACAPDNLTAAPAASAPAAKGFTPVTVEHKFGSTTVKAPPQRVVTVGLVEQDALLALGVVPVGTTEWFGEHPGAVGPWAKDKLGGAAVPQVLKDTGTGPQAEKIAALRPDLIIGLYSGLTKEQYATLSQIAPTVAQPKQYIDYGIPWQELTRTIGSIVGKPAEADTMVKGVEARFEQIKKDNPAFVGSGALMVSMYEGYFVFGSQDPRSRLLASLGFTLPPDLDKVIGDKFGANISRERLDLLDRDVLVWSVTNADKDVAALRGDGVYKNLKVAKQAREVFVVDGTDFADSASFITVLSLPFLLDRLVPMLSAAVDGKPETTPEPSS
ncbi:iron-siderophore ABC transporter substrate-binding protein [Nonomuraea sp. NPDC055795]